MIRVFPRRTKWTPDDPWAFVGDPPLFRPGTPDTPVMVSCVFTWDIPAAERLARAWGQYYRDVRLGGPAFDDPGGEFVPRLFIKHGVTITSRGCPRRCPWCFVPKREGGIRELPIRDGWIVQDNNLLACSDAHVRAVFQMLERQPHPAKFKGGLDSRLLKPWHVSALKDLRLREIWLACDSEAGRRHLEAAANLLVDIPTNKKRCFVMIGFRESLEQAEARLEWVYSLGFLPFAQLYQPDQRKRYPRDWRALARKWSRPAAYRSAANRAQEAA